MDICKNLFFRNLCQCALFCGCNYRRETNKSVNGPLVNSPCDSGWHDRRGNVLAEQSKPLKRFAFLPSILCLYSTRSLRTWEWHPPFDVSAWASQRFLWSRKQVKKFPYCLVAQCCWSREPEDTNWVRTRNFAWWFAYKVCNYTALLVWSPKLLFGTKSTVNLHV